MVSNNLDSCCFEGKEIQFLYDRNNDSTDLLLQKSAEPFLRSFWAASAVDVLDRHTSGAALGDEGGAKGMDMVLGIGDRFLQRL